MKQFTFFLSLMFSFLCVPMMATESEYDYMDRLAREAGTDKSSLFHNYTKVYSNYFSSLKDRPINFLEIGIYKGDSVKFWESYFPNANLNFIDITSSLITYYSDRSKYYYLDQSDSIALQDFVESLGAEFDIIIDDGGHYMDQQINSFLVLFPALRSGGIYVIEDLHTSYWTEYGGGGSSDNPNASPQSATEFLKHMIDDVNFVGARTRCSDFNKVPPEILENFNYYQENIISMHFYDSLCFIIKR